MTLPRDFAEQERRRFWARKQQEHLYEQSLQRPAVHADAAKKTTAQHEADSPDRVRRATRVLRGWRRCTKDFDVKPVVKTLICWAFAALAAAAYITNLPG